MDEQAVNEIRERMHSPREFSEKKKKNAVNYLEKVEDFLFEKADVINLKNGYNIIERANFEMELVPNFALIEKTNHEKFNVGFVYSDAIKQAIGSCFGDAMGIDHTGIRGTSRPEMFCGVNIECYSSDCKKRIQLVQHDVFVIRDEGGFLISVKPAITCPHCDTKFTIERSKQFV